MARKLGTEIRKQQIAQAALSLVASHGLKGLNIAGIAGQVGLAPSAVYRHHVCLIRGKGPVDQALHEAGAWNMTRSTADSGSR